MLVSDEILNAASLPGSLLEALPIGVIVFDTEGRVVLYNRAEREMARRSEADVMGKDFFTEVAPCPAVSALGTIFSEKIGRAPIDEAVEASFALPFSEVPRDVTVRMRSHVYEGQSYAVLYLEDVSAERAITRTRELLAQLLVHDLKNPLAVVMTNLELLGEWVPQGEQTTVVDSAMSASLRLRSMMANLLDITRLQTGAMPLDRQRHDAAASCSPASSGTPALLRKRGVSKLSSMPRLRICWASTTRRSYGARSKTLWTTRSATLPGAPPSLSGAPSGAAAWS